MNCPYTPALFALKSVAPKTGEFTAPENGAPNTGEPAEDSFFGIPI